MTRLQKPGYNIKMRNKPFIRFLIVVLVPALLIFSLACSASKPVQTDPGTESELPASPESNTQAEVNPVQDQTVPVEDENGGLEVQEINQTDPTNGQIERVNDLYNDAVKKWEEGDSDAALNGFDSAYVALAQIQVEDDSNRSEEKSQLRLMIAQRIQEIYASFASIGESSQFISLDENQHVLAEIKRFQTVERTYFMESYARSGLYRDMMVKKLKEAGLPEELSWLPLIESGYKIRAYSSARALGLWQFIASTGHRYGLKKDRWVDERMDPEKATDAAVLYLKELHSYFGDWTTALAAYNCGEFRIQRLIRNQKINYFDNFWDLYVMLPRETARFVPRFIATQLIVKNPEKYGLELPVPMPPMAYEKVRTEFPFKLEQLSQKLNLSQETLSDLNPELRHKSTPDRAYDLRVPPSLSQVTAAEMSSLAKWIPTELETGIHQVRKGDTVSGIARQYRSSVSAIIQLNGLSKRHTLRIGQRIRVPVRYSNTIQTKTPAQPVVTATTQPLGTEAYTVKPGDTLYAIARQYQMSVDQLKTINKIGVGTQIFPGQKLWVVTSGGSG